MLQALRGRILIGVIFFFPVEIIVFKVRTMLNVAGHASRDCVRGEGGLGNRIGLSEQTVMVIRPTWFCSETGPRTCDYPV